jgi:hypothetical protein
MSPKSRGRPAGRGRPQRKRQGPVRELRLSDRMLRDAAAIADGLDVLDVERWASDWLGTAWVQADLGEREPEKTFCLEVVGRAGTRPSPTGYAAVAALRRVAPSGEEKLLDETVAIMAESQPGPPWLGAAQFTPVRAFRATDVWDSERVLFVEYDTTDPNATKHTLMAQILEPGGTMVVKLGILHPGAAQHWDDMREPDEVPMPVTEQPVEVVLAELAGALRQTDMYWPRPDDEDYVELRALAWTRCRRYLPDWPDTPDLPDEQRQQLLDAFLTDQYPDGAAEAVRELADLFIDYGHGYITPGVLAWSPAWVELFLTDWLPRKAFLDDDQRAALPQALHRWLRFALHRRHVDPRWIEPVVAAVGQHLPEYEAAIDDEASWGPAKQIAAELAARGIDLTDKAAVDAVISELNATRLARRLIEE